MVWRCPLCNFGTSDEESGWEHVRTRHSDEVLAWENAVCRRKEEEAGQAEKQKQG